MFGKITFIAGWYGVKREIPIDGLAAEVLAFLLFKLKFGHLE
jgi:hypothetical protein